MLIIAIVATVVAVGVMGFFFGLILAIASEKFRVEVDPRIEAIEAALPGANCGGCGYPGCSGYADAIVKADAAINKCAPGGEEVAAQIANVMGKKAGESEKLVAVVACRGGADVAGSRFLYNGILDCQAAVQVASGQKGCAYGCLGFGTCVEVCPFNAIVMGKDRLPIIIEERCTGCGTCVSACPRTVIQLLPAKSHTYVLCLSQDKGGKTKKLCSVGCIGCKKCEKVCKFDAIKVENNLAVIDYAKCKSCGKCAKECPQGVIVDLRKVRKARRLAG